MLLSHTFSPVQLCTCTATCTSLPLCHCTAYSNNFLLLLFLLLLVSRGVKQWVKCLCCWSYWLLLRRSWCWFPSLVTPARYGRTLQPLRMEEQKNTSQSENLASHSLLDDRKQLSKFEAINQTVSALMGLGFDPGACRDGPRAATAP